MKLSFSNSVETPGVSIDYHPCRPQTNQVIYSSKAFFVSQWLIQCKQAIFGKVLLRKKLSNYKSYNYINNPICN